MRNKLYIPHFNFYKKPFLLLGLLFCFFIQAQAQHTVKFILKNFPATHFDDSIFLAGDLNGWNPGNTAYKFTRVDSVFLLVLDSIAPAVYQFKFTRGSWENGECTSGGANIENRLLNLQSDTVLELSVAGWLDDFSTATPKHTASSHVSIMSKVFFIPQLDRKRTIRLYLPEGYETGKKRYPVLYMHDGQNIFDQYTASFGEWGVDECLDSLIKDGKPACIVVGIDNGPERVHELNPYNHPRFGKGEGDAYVDFITKTLKPFVDKHYRTLTTKENTIIAGSSLGGLISLYAMLKYPEVYGKAGIFSPAFWVAPALDSLIDSLAVNLNGKLFFMIGGQEGKEHIKNMQRIQEKIGVKSSAMIYSVEDAEGKHNEQAWRKWFYEFYNWIMAPGYNIITNRQN